MFSDEIIRKIIKNSNIYREITDPSISLKEYILLHKSIFSLFCWTDTIEGVDYWSSMYKIEKTYNTNEYVEYLLKYINFKKNEPLKFLPIL